jgi:hypothetical protein
MKRFILAIATAALAACNQSEPADAPADEATAAQPVAAPASNATPGTYQVTQADGSTRTTVLGTDHSYTDTVGGEVVEKGSWATVGGKTCFTPSEGEGAVAMCYSDSPIGEDGTFTATPDEGDPITVKKVG